MKYELLKIVGGAASGSLATLVATGKINIHPVKLTAGALVLGAGVSLTFLADKQNQIDLFVKCYREAGGGLNE